MVIRSFLIIVGNGHIMKGFYFAWLFYYILLQSAMRKRRGIIFLMLLQYINITYKAAKVELAGDQRLDEIFVGKLFI